MQPQVKAIALDLSQPYLARAKKRAAKMGQAMEFLAAPAEKIPLPDASVDVVTSIYLFHELPPKIRAAAASEIARVLKPGGLFVFADSIQYGDAPDFDGLLDVFPDLLHEPYYTSYAKTDLKQLFAKAGLMPGPHRHRLSHENHRIREAEDSAQAETANLIVIPGENCARSVRFEGRGPRRSRWLIFSEFTPKHCLKVLRRGEPWVPFPHSTRCARADRRE